MSKWYWPSAGGTGKGSAGSARTARRLPPLDLHGAFLRKADLSETNLSRANCAGTDFTDANLRGSDLADADLRGAVLRGADLRDTKNLTVEQLADAIIDDSTLLPSYLSHEDLLRQREGAV
jgi:uncharacterized protein YjbI with pentapeptide repeats